jgi:hypothetical protein
VRESFGPSAVGIISNFGDQYFNPDLVRRIRGTGVETIVYSGPIAILDEPMPLWNMIQANEIRWVYGLAETPRDAPQVGPLPGGPAQLEVNGIMFRHFSPGPGAGELQRLGAMQWPPPGKAREDAVTRLAEGSQHRIVVCGSGLEYERWVLNRNTGRWDLYEQNVEGYGDMTVVRIALNADERQVIVHPTSRGDFFSVIEPDENRMVLVTA